MIETQQCERSSRLSQAGAEGFLAKQKDIFDREYREDSATSSDAGRYRYVRSHVFDNLAEIVRKAIAPHSEVLDIGCGDGSMLRALSPDISRGVGIDISATAVARARRTHTDGGRLAFLSGNVATVDLSSSFDAILMLDVFEHLTNVDAVLQRCRGWLKPAGILIVATPNVRRLTNAIKETAMLSPITGAEIDLIPAHFREYSFGELKRMLARFGFAVERYEANTLIDLKYIPALALNRTFVFRTLWTFGRVFPAFASNYVLIARRAR